MASIPNAHDHPPPLFSAVRIGSFLTCLLVALGAGTNYVFSAYGPQLGARLRLTHTQVNAIGLSGNMGVYGTAPLWGWLVDSRGPRALLFCAFFGLLIGYLGIWRFYSAGLPDGVSADLLTICALTFFGFLTGAGGNGGLTGAMNTTAKMFPDHLRSSATGIVVSGFGLSAFLFSTVAHVFFPGNTSSFLLVLACGTSLPMILGFFFVRPIPLPHVYNPEGGFPEDTYDGPATRSAPPAAVFTADNNSHTALLPPTDDIDLDDDEEETSALATDDERAPLAHAQQTSPYLPPVATDAVQLSPTAGHARRRSRSAASRRSGRDGHDKAQGGLPNVFGKRLFTTLDFWLLFSITSLLSGTGIMYINNVGAISQALFANNNPDYDPVQAAQWQATQVSTVSVMNCLGRIIVGVIADVTKSQLRLPRAFCIVLVAVMFIISQLVCFHTEEIRDLWKASALLGVAYGGMFGLFPSITIEWFGLPHFSENWGYINLSPIIGGNIFSLAFGKNLDAHSDDDTGIETIVAANATSTAAVHARGGVPSAHHCIVGRACYADSLKLTTAATCLALALGLFAAWRDYKRQKKWAARLGGAQGEVLWAADEE